MNIKHVILSALVMCVSLCYGNGARLYFENDFPFGDDSDYSNGTRVDYLGNGFSVFAGQHLYTPSGIQNETYHDGTHPYAGYLYAGVGIDRIKQVDVGLRVTRHTEISTGIVGPGACGEEVQKFIHGIVGAHEPKGWKYQLDDELEIEFVHFSGIESVICGRSDGWNLTAGFEAGGLFGTLQRAAGINAETRFGYGTVNRYDCSEITVRGAVKEFAVCGIIGAEGRYWDWNTFLDGNYRKRHDYVHKEEFTAVLKTGIAACLKDWELCALFMFSTREYEEQTHVPHYASFQLTRRF